MAVAEGGRRCAAPAVFAVLLLSLAGYPTRAHLGYGTSTLRLLTLESDLVALVRIVDAETELRVKEPILREAVVVAEVIETLKGVVAEGPLRFVQHGHGTPKYAQREEVLLFLQRIDRNRELGQGPIAAHIQWVSVQEAGAKFEIPADARNTFASAIRAYAAEAELPIGQRFDAMRLSTIAQLTSSYAKLASSALRDLVIAGDALVLRPEDLPRLEATIASPATSIGVRIGLLSELERRRLLEGAPRWARLLRTTTGADRMSAVRAAAAHPSGPVTKELVALLSSPDPLLVAAAAFSLGAPGSQAAVAPLSELLASEEARVRMAAIRGLGRVATPSAQAALAETAQSHPDGATRKSATAALKILARGADAEPQ